MRYIIHDKRYQFRSAFDTKTAPMFVPVYLMQTAKIPV